MMFNYHKISYHEVSCFIVSYHKPHIKKIMHHKASFSACHIMKHHTIEFHMIKVKLIPRFKPKGFIS